VYIKEDERAKPNARNHNAQTVEILHKVRNIMQYCIAQMLFACSAAQRCGLEPKTCCIEMMCMQAESQLEVPCVPQMGMGRWCEPNVSPPAVPPSPSPYSPSPRCFHQIRQWCRLPTCQTWRICINACRDEAAVHYWLIRQRHSHRHIFFLQ